MPVRKGLIKLYDAKALMMETLTNNIGVKATPEAKLWLAVIEQAVFDAHLHATAGNFMSVIWVRDARKFFSSKEFEVICAMLGLEPEWVRSLVDDVKRLAVKLRGKEYQRAARHQSERNRTKRQAASRPRPFQLEFMGMSL